MSAEEQAVVLTDAVVMAEHFSYAAQLQAAGDLAGLDRAAVLYLLHANDETRRQLDRVDIALRARLDVLEDDPAVDGAGA